MGSRLHPDPPHLAVSTYPDRRSGMDAFAAMCRVVEEAGGTPSLRVKAVPADAHFDAISDIGGTARELEVDGGRFHDLIAGRDPHLRAVVAGFHIDPVGLAIVTYDRRQPGDQWPITVLSHAAGLDLPEELRSPEDAETARRTGQWARDLLRSACADIAPLYAALTIEQPFPTPSALNSSSLRLTDIYASSRLLNADPHLAEKLRECYSEGDIEPWTYGLFLSAWAPFNKPGRTASDLEALGSRTAALLRQGINS